MKKVTSQDVAKAAGVSQTTVSFILNGTNKMKFSEETRERVLSVAAELGYALPASAGNKKPQVRKKLLGVLVPNLANYYYTKLIQYVQNHARDNGYHLMVCSTFYDPELERFYLSQFKEADGILYTFSPQLIKEIKKIADRMPVVVMGERVSGSSVCYMELPGVTAGARVAEYLYSLGHRRYLFASAPLGRHSFSMQQRLKGLKSVLEGYGLRDAVSELTLEGNADHDYAVNSVAYEFEAGRSMMLQALRQGLDGATAVVCLNDMTAFGVMEALKAYNISIPAQMSVCGFDNLMPGVLTNPPLTTVDNQLQKSCELAMEHLMGRKKDAAAVSKAAGREDTPRVMVRGSTGPALK